MKRKTWITTAIILVLIALCASLWQYKTFQNDNLKVMCKSSVNAALEHFEAYETNRNEADYIAGVAEFRTYMTTYLCLEDGASNTDYIWCNTLYRNMLYEQEKLKPHIAELVDALAYLAEDYDHPNGFHCINALNNQLKTE